MRNQKDQRVKAKIIVTLGESDGAETIVLYRGGKTGLASRSPSHRVLKEAARHRGKGDAASSVAPTSAAVDSSTRGGSMNTDQFKGKWVQFKGEVKKQWGKFTDDDLKQIEGDYDKFVGRIQERYGDKKEEVMRWADDWYTRQGQPGSQPREAHPPR